MPFYEKGDVRIRYEEAAPASRCWAPRVGA